MLNIFNRVMQLFLDLGKFVVDTINGDSQPKDIIFLIALGVFVIYVVLAFMRTSSSYEMRVIHSIDQINAYLYKHPDITEENVVEFNEIMKKIPKQMRTQWQLFMLYREGAASQYLCEEKVIDQPLKTSTYKHSIRTLSKIYDVLVILCGMIIFAGLIQISGDNVLGFNMFFGLSIPLLLIVFKHIFLVFMDARLNSVTKDLYLNYNVFERAIDKATVALPEYVDYEILFTRQEIKEGIPILKDYLERREKLKAEELERARQSIVEHEQYDFSSLGVNASALLERTVKECEAYLNNRKRLLTQIEQLEAEITSYKNNYELTNKEFIRKQQASKENLERFRQAQETATNRIEVSSIRKQQEAEMKKQEQYEKDANEALNNYNTEKTQLDAKIAAVNDELTAKKKYIEEAIMLEFKGYADRIFGELKYIADEQVKEEKLQLIEENKRLSGELERKLSVLDDRDKELSIKNSEVELAKNENEKQKLEMNKLASEFSEKSRQLVDARKGKKQLEKADDKVTSEESKIIEAALTEQAKNEAELAKTKEEEKELEPVYDDNGGYFDKKGYYRYKNGTYYDPQGLFHDGKGKIYNEQGGLVGTEDVNGVMTPVASPEVKVEEVKQETAVVEEVKPQGEVAEEVKPVEEVKSEGETAEKDNKASKKITKKSTKAAEEANADEEKRLADDENKVVTKKTTTKITTDKTGAKSTVVTTTTKVSADKPKTTRKKKVVADGDDTGKDKSLEDIEKEIAEANKELAKNQEELNATISETDDVIK